MFYRRYIVTITLLFLLFLGTESSCTDSCNIVLKGKIVEAHNGRPLEFSTIQDKGGKFSAIADKEGMFVIENICPGKYSLHFKHLICEHLDIELRLSKDTFIEVKLPHVDHNLSTVLVIGNKKFLFNNNDRLSQDALENMQGMSIGRMMAELPGVSNLSTGGTVSKPMINGMYGYRTLVINNGIRQEGQNWGQEHAPEIDPFLAKEIELLKGPKSLKYGPEAIGGVILVNPVSIFNYRKNHVTGAVHSGFSSNGRMGVFSANMGGRFFTKVPLYWRAQGTIKGQGNLKAPDYYINNTGYKEQNFSWTMGTHFGRFTIDAFYSLFNTSFGIYSGAHIGNLTDLKNTVNGLVPPKDKGFSYTQENPRQEALHELFKVRVFYKLGTHQYLKFVGARQFNQRKEFDLHLGSNDVPQFDYRITTHTGDLFWEMEGHKNFSQQLGINTMYQANTFSGRFFIPNFENKGIGLFYIAQIEIKKFLLNASIRMDYRDLTSYYFVNRDSLVSPNRTFLNSAAAVGVEYQARKNLRIVLNVGRNWRPPMPNELYSEGIHHGAASYEEGNPNMKEEVSYKAELDVYWVAKEKFQVIGGVFFQKVDDFINLIPAAEPKATIRGAFPYFYYDQTDAFFRGLNLMFTWKPTSSFSLEQRSSLLWADDLSRNTFLPQMPPFRFGLEPVYIFKKLGFRLKGQVVARQFRLEPEMDFAPAPNAYFLLGAEVKGKSKVGKQVISYFIRGENLTNQKYRDYLDRFRYFIDRPGVNVNVGVSYSF